MKKEEILQIIKNLSKAQGFYSGLYNFLIENSEESKEYIDMLESKNFKDPAELILYFEG